MTIRKTVGKHLLIVAATALLAGPAWAGYGAGDGTGNDGDGPADGTGNGSTTGDCTSSTALKYSTDLLVVRGGNGHGGDNGGYGPGDGTGNDGDGPADGTGNGPGTGDCANS